MNDNLIEYQVLDDETYDYLLTLDGVESMENIEIPPYEPWIEQLLEYYLRVVYDKSTDYNASVVQDVLDKLNDMIDEKFNTTNFNHNNYPVVNLDGYQFAHFESGTYFFKGTTWFFDEIPQTSRIWVGDYETAKEYLRRYFTGTLAYRTKESVRSFILGKENLDKLHEDNETPESIKQIIELAFGIGISLEEQIRRTQKPVWIHKKRECIPGLSVTRYNVHWPRFRHAQHELFDYIEKRFSCQSTLLPPLASPFVICIMCEITLQPEILEIDKDHPLSWTTWPFDDKVRHVKHLTSAAFCNKNKQFRVVNWLDSFDHLDFYTTDILSVNVHFFVSIVEHLKGQPMIDLFIDFVNKVRPVILTMQEVPKSEMSQIKRRLGYDRAVFAKNGAQDDNLGIALFTNLSGRIRTNTWRYDKWRSSIQLDIGGKRLLFIHGPIGQSYFKRSGLHREKFYPMVKKNRALRNKFIADIIETEADFVVGDWNMLPAETWHLDQLALAEYQTDQQEEYTSINGVKVDWAWFKTGASGRTHVYNWPYSDHRPIGFTFDRKPWTKKIKGGEDEFADEFADLFSAISAVIIVMLISVVLIISSCISSCVSSFVSTTICMFNNVNDDDVH